ncbi:MAG: hypothetical protein HOL19_04000, partial [Flavobacteriaceae bacterium]|nr:hypothetical protein [Flavobacteriaceae bacterium]
SKMVKDGGKMVYATCSILPQENSQQVAHFLKSEAGANFTLTREQKVYASKSGFDGFYIALLEKKITTTQENTPKAKAVQLEAKTTETGTVVATLAVKKTTTQPKAAKAEATKATPEKAASKTPKAKTTAKAAAKTAVKTTTKAAPKTAAKTTKSKVSEEVVKKPAIKVKKVTKE